MPRTSAGTSFQRQELILYQKYTSGDKDLSNERYSFKSHGWNIWLFKIKTVKNSKHEFLTQFVIGNFWYFVIQITRLDIIFFLEEGRKMVGHQVSVTSKFMVLEYIEESLSWINIRILEKSACSNLGDSNHVLYNV